MTATWVEYSKSLHGLNGLCRMLSGALLGQGPAEGSRVLIEAATHYLCRTRSIAGF